MKKILIIISIFLLSCNKNIETNLSGKNINIQNTNSSSNIIKNNDVNLENEKQKISQEKLDYLKTLSLYELSAYNCEELNPQYPEMSDRELEIKNDFEKKCNDLKQNAIIQIQNKINNLTYNDCEGLIYNKYKDNKEISIEELTKICQLKISLEKGCDGYKTKEDNQKCSDLRTLYQLDLKNTEIQNFDISNYL